MFGAGGNPDHDDSVRIITARPRRRDQLRRHRRRLLARGIRRDRRQGARRRPARRRRAGDEGARQHGRRPQRAGQLPALDHPGGREQPAPARDRLDRPLPDPPARRDGRHRRDARRTDRPGAGRQDPLLRIVHLPGVPDRRGAVGGREAAAASGSSASSRRTRSWSAASSPTCCRSARSYGMGVIPWSPLAGGWLSGRFRKGQDAPQTHRARRLPERFDLSEPDNQREAGRRRAARAARGEGRHHAWSTSRSPSSLRHPAVTSAIIGPRTMEQLESQLGAADVTLSAEVLDRSTRSCRPAPTSTPATPAGSPRRSPSRACGGADRPGPGPVTLRRSH